VATVAGTWQLNVHVRILSGVAVWLQAFRVAIVAAMRSGGGTGTRGLIALGTTLACALCAVASLAGATTASGGNPNLVADTVYQGVFASAENTWTGVGLQFVVTSSETITDVAKAYAYCAPIGDPLPFSSSAVHGDLFSVATPPFTPGGYHVSITGRFLPNAHASGTGSLHGETIQSQVCNEDDTWKAIALPAGTQLCPSIDPGTPMSTTVTNMTCAKAALAYAAGQRESSKNPSQSPNVFDVPGYLCHEESYNVGGAVNIQLGFVCTRGTETFRLPS
jgi:hypothetical protein